VGKSGLNPPAPFAKGGKVKEDVNVGWAESIFLDEIQQIINRRADGI
jgi:hypothetical protein